MRIFTRARTHETLWALAVFLLALIPRLIGLGKTVVADEQLWINRSIGFLKALFNLDLAATAQSSHPGVIPMWLGSISLAINHLFNSSTEVVDRLFAAQLPLALATSALIVVIFWLVRSLFGPRVAGAAAVLLATCPFLVAFSRILHLDALLAGFMAVAVLALLVHLEDPSGRRWMLVLSAVAAGMAILTKLPAFFLFPLAAFAYLLAAVHGSAAQAGPLATAIRKSAGGFALWCGLTLATVFVLWPALWTDPLLPARIIARATGMQAHEHGQFFLGQPVADPGWAFYPVVILFRTTPIVLIFGAIALVTACLRIARSGSFRRVDTLSRLTLVCFGVMFVVFMSIAGKKMDRYILPVFPILSILASLAIVDLYDILVRSGRLRLRSMGVLNALPALALLLIQAPPLFALHPYYSTHYNPMAGGPAKAKEMLLIGRGEGLELVAEYLKQKDHPTDLKVGSEFAYILKVFFPGELTELKVEAYQDGTLQQLDYLVIYISGLQQRHLRLPEEILEYHASHAPEHTVSINGLDYAYIHRLGR